MKEAYESKKNDDLKEEENQKLKSESNQNQESNIVTSTNTNEYIFGKEQQMCVCPFCHIKMFTDIEQEVSWIGVVLSILILIFLKIYGIIFLILIIKFTQNTTHSCPNCLNKIGVYTVFDALSLQDKVFTIQFSHFGMIITKKHLFGLLSFFIFGIIFYFILSTLKFNRVILKETWNDFNLICSQGETMCNTKFLYQDISWTGYVIRVNFNDNFFSRVRVFFLIKMNQDLNNDNTDLILEVTDKVYEKYKIDIMNLTRGDEISFNATVKQTPSNKGNNVPIVLLNNIKLTGNNIHINPHVHENGRYGTKEGQFEEGKKIYEELPNVVTTGGKNIKKL